MGHLSNPLAQGGLFFKAMFKNNINDCLLTTSLVEIELGISGANGLYSDFSTYKILLTEALLIKWTWNVASSDFPKYRKENPKENPWKLLYDI